MAKMTRKTTLTSTKYLPAVITVHTVKCHKCLSLHAAVQQFDDNRCGIVVFEVNKQ